MAKSAKSKLNGSAATLAVAAVLLGLVVTCTAPAVAQQRTLNPEQACRDDAFRLCNEFIPDRNRVGACLHRNARSLSPDCHIVMFGAGGGPRHRASRRAVHHRHHRQS